MRCKKTYGESREDSCVFCSKKALTENSQGLPACLDHNKSVLEDKKCVCGQYLDIKRSKWGAFFLCENCGSKSIKKVLNNEEGDFKLNKKYRPKQYLTKFDEIIQSDNKKKDTAIEKKTYTKLTSKESFIIDCMTNNYKKATQKNKFKSLSEQIKQRSEQISQDKSSAETSLNSLSSNPNSNSENKDYDTNKVYTLAELEEMWEDK